MLKKLYALRRGYVVLGLTLLSVGNSNATSVIYQFEPVSTGSFPGGQSPEIQAVFADENPGMVLLTITSAGLGCGQFLSDLYFNFDPADNLKRLHFTALDGTRCLTFPKVSKASDGFKADSGYYDIRFDFAKTCKGKFSGNDYVTYQIAEPGLDAADFDFVDSTRSCGGASGKYYALADVQGICGTTEWLGCRSLQPVPEPGPLAFQALAAGLAWCIHTRVNRTRRNRSLG
jgi:hypothetical protein